MMKKNKEPLAWGQFQHDGQKIVYVDMNGKKWSSEHIAHLIQVFTYWTKVQKFLDHYKKFL